MIKSQSIIFELQLSSVFYILLWAGILSSFLPLFEEVKEGSFQAYASYECQKIASILNRNAMYGKEFSTLKIEQDFEIVDFRGRSIRNSRYGGDNLTLSVNTPTGKIQTSCQLIYSYYYSILDKTPTLVPMTYWRYVEDEKEYLEW